MKNVSYFCPQIVLMYNEMNVLELSEQEIIRRNSMNELRAMGIEPYPAAMNFLSHHLQTDWYEWSMLITDTMLKSILSKRNEQ